MKKRSIALICTELEGINSSDDRVGSANVAIANSLSRAGHEVTIFFVSRSARLVPLFCKCKSNFKKNGIGLQWLPEPEMLVEGLDPARLSYAAYLFLRTQKFDIIHFQGAHGLGYYSALAKSLGLDFIRTLICIDLHAPGYWARYANEELVLDPKEILQLFLERKSVELADVLVAPSCYILGWAESQKWKLPSLKLVEQFPILPIQKKSCISHASKFKEIIFYGKIEKKNGVLEFCNAINLLPKDFLKQNRIKVTFLGTFEISEAIGTASFYLSQVAKRWTHKWKILSNLSREQSLNYISLRNALVVIPYREDSMGHQVLECLELGVLFIASDIPIFREIIDQRDHKSVLFKKTASALSDRIKSALSYGVKTAHPAMPSKVIATNWGAWHGKIQISQKKLNRTKVPSPLVSICVTHRDRPQFLKQCLDSLESQTYKKIEVILMDDASDTLESIKFLRMIETKFNSNEWKLVRQKKRIGPSANRNLAAKIAKGEYLLFMDDDNIAKPFEVSTFLKAARNSGSDILTCACDRFTGPIPPIGAALRRWPPVGDVQALGLFYNLIGDMNFLIKRKVFLSLGGLSQQKFNVGAEDAEFLVNAVFKGYSLTVVPEALYWYRYHDKNLSARNAVFETQMKQARPYNELVKNQDLNHLMSFSLSMWFRIFNREDRSDRLFPRLKGHR
jgi:O-antigen biosynthesis protein